VLHGAAPHGTALRVGACLGLRRGAAGVAGALGRQQLPVPASEPTWPLNGMLASSLSKALCLSVVTMMTLSPRSYVSRTLPCTAGGGLCVSVCP
jgi:hypothetical protein